jgi:hypothetical protein
MNFLENETLKNSKFNIFIILFLGFIGFILFIIVFYRNEINKINFLQISSINKDTKEFKVDELTTDANKIKELPTNQHNKDNILLNNKDNELQKTPYISESQKENIKKETETYNEKKEVYNISQNIYTYDDAPYVCKIFGGRLATKKELEKEFLKGADWCNYGWSDNQEALYPTQKKSWDKLQKTETYKDMCGKPGINGGFFDNPDLKFGVNCYGIKPKKTDNNTHSISINTLKTPKELEIEQKMKELELKKDTIQFLPFNHIEWSSSNEISSTNFINEENS